MRRALLACLAVLAPLAAHAQSSPGLVYLQVPSAAQWNSYFTAKQDALGFTPVNKAGDTVTGALILSGGANITASTGLKQNGTTVLNITGGTYNSGTFAPTCTSNCGVRVGALAGVNLPAGDSLTVAVGYHALASANPTDPSGTESTAVGWNAAGNITGAGPYFLTILGVNAQGACTTGCLNNIAIGTDAMRDTLAATEGIALGQYALGRGPSTLSIGIGNGALKGNVSNTSVSTWNVAIGHQAMFGTNATTLAENVAVGAFAMTAATSASKNVAVGAVAGNAMTTDTQNVFVGWKAGLLQAGAHDNTCVGFFCLSGAITSSGNFNNAFGSYAGAAMTSGYQNNLFGYQTGQAMTTAQGNAAFGDQVMRAVTTGYENVGMGNLTMYAATGAYRNVAIGTAAGGAMTADTANVFIGWKAGFQQIGAQENNCIGFLCLGGLITSAGSNNNSHGAYAGLAITSGYGNALFGDRSGLTITTGCQNTVLGTQVASTTLTTGCSNILIGTSSAVDTTAAGSSHQINIGGLIFYNKTSTAAPAVSACGTSPSIDARANNRSGTVTAGTAGPVSCTVTFAGGGYGTWNHCRVTSQSSVASFAYTVSTTAIVITGAAFTSAKFDYDCDGL